MSKTPNTKLIGLFTLVGLAAFVGFLFVFLSDKLFVKEKDLLVMYFEESVKGLNVGSPVVLQGVEIGKVFRVDMVADTENLTFKIPVYVKINKSNVIISNTKESSEDSEHLALVERLVEKGLRARLATQNFLTGQLMIELVMQPEEKALLKDDGKHKEIPTVLSSFGELSKSLQDLPVREGLDKLNTLLGQTSVMVTEINKLIKDTATDRANMMGNLNKTIRDIGEAAQSLRNFSDYIERHPEALLKGKGGY